MATGVRKELRNVAQNALDALRKDFPGSCQVQVQPRGERAVPKSRPAAYQQEGRAADTSPDNTGSEDIPLIGIDDLVKDNPFVEKRTKEVRTGVSVT